MSGCSMIQHRKLMSVFPWQNRRMTGTIKEICRKFKPGQCMYYGKNLEPGNQTFAICQFKDIILESNCAGQYNSSINFKWFAISELKLLIRNLRIGFVLFMFFGKSKSKTPEYIKGYTGHSMIWPQHADKGLLLNQFYCNQVWFKNHK